MSSGKVESVLRAVDSQMASRVSLLEISATSRRLDGRESRAISAWLLDADQVVSVDPGRRRPGDLHDLSASRMSCHPDVTGLHGRAAAVTCGVAARRRCLHHDRDR